MIQHSKNIVYGSITAGGDIHIGDVTYNVEKEFNRSILFLRIESVAEGGYSLQLSVKSSQSSYPGLSTSGQNLLREAVRVELPYGLSNAMGKFQSLRRGAGHQMRDILSKTQPVSVVTLEDQLSQQLYDAFFSADIGQVCTDFIQMLEERRIEELLLVISTGDDDMANLPFEMVLPHLFPPKQGQAKRSLAVSGFGLVRTSVQWLEKFQMQGEHAKAAPLKMLFITALPENLDEHSKMLQIEEEQTRLIRAIGGLEATGDNEPKIAIEFLENASLEELEKALGERQHDIVHISGHGAYHAGQNKGVLYFENEDGDEKLISGAALRETLRAHTCVKLLVLSACETAMSGSEGGVAQQLAEYGVPAIVAMRFAVTDEGAKTFTTELYTKLTDGEPLTRAVAYAREALYKTVKQNREQAPQITHLAEWFTPVVYQNQELGPLIDNNKKYIFPERFYHRSAFLKADHTRLIGEGFIGRKRYLIRMRRAFREGRHVCLHGLGGLGKTTLAEAFANHYDNRSHTVYIFRKGQKINEAHILLTLNKSFSKINPELSEQLLEVIEDKEEATTVKLQLLINNYLSGRKTILVFDNMEDVQMTNGDDYQRGISNPELQAFFRYFCENAPTDCHLIFTTRYKIQDLEDVVEHFALNWLSYAEQYRLLNYSDYLRTIPLEEREKVYKRLEGHPRGYEYLEALLKKDKSFTWQQVADSEERIFENLLLRKVYERLEEQEKELFQLVAVFITRTPLAALAAVSGVPEADLWPVLQSLHDWSLCFLEEDGRFEVHRLTREWMQQHITPVEKVKEWAFQAGTYFKMQSTWEGIELARSYYELAEAWNDFAHISFGLQGEYERIGLNQRVLELNQIVLKKNINKYYNGQSLNNIGYLLVKTGNYNEALFCFEQSLLIYKEISDRQGEGTTLNNIAQIYHAEGDYDTSLHYLSQSLAILQEISDRQSEGHNLGNIGQIYYAKGDYDIALHYLKQSLAILQEMADSKGEGTTLNNIGQIYDAKGDFVTALYYYKKSLTILQEIGDRKGEGSTLNNIGGIHKIRGDYHTALHYYEKSFVILQEIGDRQGAAAILNNLAAIAHAKRDYDDALRHYEKSLDIVQEIGDRKGEGSVLNNIGGIYSERGDYDTALGHFEKSLAILQEIGDRQAEGITLNSIGGIYKERGDYDTALGYFEKSLAILREIGDRKGEGTALNNIAGAMHAKDDHYTALHYYEKSLAILQEIGDRKGEGITLNNIAQNYHAKGDYDIALRYYEKSLAILQEISDNTVMAAAMYRMGVIYLNYRDDIVTAILFLYGSYNLLTQLGSSNSRHPAAYLQKIIKRIGEDRYR